MSDKKYWIWLQLALGEGAKFSEILDEFGSPEKLYKSNILEWKMCPLLTPKQVDKLEATPLEAAAPILYTCEQNGWKIITYEEKAYPNSLRKIPNPPAVLYVNGDLINFDHYAVIGIVGTRNASSYGVKAARVMAKGVSLCGAVVISGGALGIDTAAHEGALEAGAKTFLVMGCGLGARYLAQNQPLRDAVLGSGGALITEYPPFTEPRRNTFPLRNRIISGLADGILVVEAGEKSGSIITASHASEQGKDIFAVPASLFDYNFYGTNRLIDDGATVATSPEVLLERYVGKYKTLDLSKGMTIRELLESSADRSANAHKREQVTFDHIRQDRAERLQREEKTLQLKGDEQTVYRALTETFATIDEITERCCLNTAATLAALTMLEMKKLAERTSGKRYRRI